ncbi:MAG: hypothetical protein P8100_06645 [bacterium]
MKKIIMTMAIVIGMAAATMASENEVSIKLEENKLHYNYYTNRSIKDIRLDRESRLIVKTNNGITLELPVDAELKGQKGNNSESISVSFDPESCEVDLLSKRNITEVALRHANGVEYHFMEE